jgi:hypothetical protein
MKKIHLMGLTVSCCVVLFGSAPRVAAAPLPGTEEIAAHAELVVPAIRGQPVAASAAIVLQVQALILAADWPETRKRAQVIALITYAVAAKGNEAAPMMGLVAAGTPPAWLAVIAATAVMAAGNSSPTVAKAMIAAVAGDAQAAGTCTAACANPATVLAAADLGVVRGITLPTPTQVPAKAPPLPTLIQQATKYPGQ